jgi:type II secretory pathway pseudopilin PulG
LNRWLILAGVILGAGIAVWFISRPARQRSHARHDVDVLAVALDGFALEQGAYPRGDFAQICRLLRGETIDGQNPRRLDYVEVQAYEINAKGEFIDPWGEPYRVDFSPVVRVYSCGPNRVDERGGGDDIVAGR